MKALRLYNTLTRQKELFKPLFSPKVRIYTCGPTVYDHTHLGHMRTYTNTDILVRVLKYFNYQPYQVMNITDVGHLLGDRDLGEDKMEKAARKEKKDAWEIADKYSEEFFLVMKKLNIGKADVVSKATDNISPMILLVQELERRGFTYKTDDGIYFDTAKLSDYGKLAHMPREKLVEGARIEPNPQKHNSTDFALWKFTPKGTHRQMEWVSPWYEKSFPGWHIECSAMAMRHLSNCFVGKKFYPQRFETIDIHTGGVDHIAVHHTNEIAQVEAATEKKFVNYWMHSEFLQVDGKKMSKSLGNFYTLFDLESRGYKDLMPLRYLFLNTHYRKKMNFTWKALSGAEVAYENIVRDLSFLPDQIWALRLANKRVGARRGNNSDRNKEKYYLAEFADKLANDLNMPQAIAVLHKVLNDNSLPPLSEKKIIANFDLVLGLKLLERAEAIRQSREKKLPAKVAFLIKEREVLREKEKWVEADKIRKEIKKLGYKIEDTPEGAKITVKKTRSASWRTKLKPAEEVGN